MPRRASKLRPSPLLFATLIVADASAQEALEWLERMSRAVEDLDYRGTFVRMLDGDAQTLEVVHRSDDGTVAERIVALDGAGREIIRQAGEVRYILPDQRVVLVDERAGGNPLVSAIPSGAAELEANYELTLGGTARVAGRTTRVLEIAPRDEFRYGYRLWLDSETAMPLKSQLVDTAGETVQEILFTDIELAAAIPAAALEPTIDTTGFTFLKPAEAPSAVAAGFWQAADLPSGFRLSAANEVPMPGSAFPVAHLVYSDDLFNVSVFIESPQSTAEIGEGFTNVGSSLVYSSKRRDRWVTAIGEGVPPRTLRRIVLSVQPE